jgi:hypothetical protein
MELFQYPFHRATSTFDNDSFGNRRAKRTYPLRITFLIIVLWLASSAAFGSLVAIWTTSSGKFNIADKRTVKF